MTEGIKKTSARQEQTPNARSIPHAASTESRLYHRLEEALHSGSEVWFRMPGTRLVGIPIFLDTDYVEVVDVDVAEGFEDEELPDEPYQRTVWLIRLEEISAISYATDRWSKERFERLLEQSHKDDNIRDDNGRESLDSDDDDEEEDAFAS
ncbi:MAG: Hydrolase of X-linked nucleoside diphosphate N terminal [Phormidesmis priestleyi Ana]|uniref:Hydrolase of X-linked nucleoside diphosphate N terminal n=1 Tax=Phormidesmis priestleyi Ana TaxID=1666911 RepID=A0A0P7ZTB3_9CYAN|nr:MAG: Hydrolase of X-linked nucleoside diphosphate N terminal [Phormidesmis priestleyi Ana]